MKRSIAIVALTVAAIAGASSSAPVAGAIPPGPNSCVSGGGGFIGFGGYEDCDLWPDGSFWHRWWGGGPFAAGGGAGRVCDGLPPVPTDSDPRTPC